MPQSQQRAPCQIFNKIIHSALDCFYRMDHSYQRRQPPARPVVGAVARIQPGLWYTDTGATNHVTSDLSNLSLHFEYQGGDQVAIGHGNGLAIKNYDSSLLATASKPLKLTHILNVPDIASNLISVNRFCKDIKGQFGTSNFSL